MTTTAPTVQLERVRVRLFNRGRLLETHYVETFEEAMTRFVTSQAPTGTAFIDGGTLYMVEDDIVDFQVYANGPVLRVTDMAARSNARKGLVTAAA